MPKGEMILRKNQVVSSIFILTDGTLKVMVLEEEQTRKSNKMSSFKHSRQSHDILAALDAISVSSPNAEGTFISHWSIPSLGRNFSLKLSNNLKLISPYST